MSEKEYPEFGYF